MRMQLWGSWGLSKVWVVGMSQSGSFSDAVCHYHLVHVLSVDPPQAARAVVNTCYATAIPLWLLTPVDFERLVLLFFSCCRCVFVSVHGIRQGKRWCLRMWIEALDKDATRRDTLGTVRLWNLCACTHMAAKLGEIALSHMQTMACRMYKRDATSQF